MHGDMLAGKKVVEGVHPDAGVEIQTRGFPDAFTDRQREIRELSADIRNGQNVVIIAPRRYGKTSLVGYVARRLARQGVLVAGVDLMRTPTKERLAAHLAAAIHDQLATPGERLKQRVQIFSSLRITPTVTVDPADGKLSFSFEAGHRREDIDATLERLFELPAEIAADRNKRVALVLDEFQEVDNIDPQLPPLMRSIFQQQPNVSHVYLGSKRHMMRRIFVDANEPFWRSAKVIELSVIPPDLFSQFIVARFAATDRGISDQLAERVVTVTRSHPYGTQELCYAVWEETELEVTDAAVERALDRVLRAENAHFTYVWDTIPRTQRLVLQALAAQSAGRPLSDEYRSRHGLPAASSVQRAIGQLVDAELIARHGRGSYAIFEPFLAEWVRRFAA